MRHKAGAPVIAPLGHKPKEEDMQSKSTIVVVGFLIIIASLLAQTLALAASEKRFEDMTAIEVAQDPAAYGFVKSGSKRTDPTEAGLRAGMKPSRDDQWTKKTPDGKLYILTIHYEDDKLVSAKWGGF